MPPALVAHADWSTGPEKRWLAAAVLRADGRYRLASTVRVGPLEDFWRSLDETGERALLGFDFPLGLPRAYAERAAIDDFVAVLEHFGEGRWRQFYDVASEPVEIHVERPFFPLRPGGCRRQELLDGLGLCEWSDLLRRCDRRSATRNAACALFWTLGGSQVGKAAIAGWRDLLGPALRAGLDVALWPFQGPLEALLARHRFVIAETYPAEVYGHLDLALRGHGGKRSQAARRANAVRLLAQLRRLDVEPEPAARAEIADGFGPAASGEDRFDAVVGLLGMLNVVLGRRASGEPDDPIVRRIEGWILGQTAE
ncbi:MAG: Methyltransferase type 12 [Geminicoccaceae bacterium]|nr:Methyltransferase type 12 [Geminicoccaceae bacterium]